LSLLPGLPSLPNDFPAFVAGISLLTDDLVSPPQTNQWGIFLNGEAVVLADNVLSLEFKQEFSICDYPVEGGSFASYNKVQRPAEAKVRFSAGTDLPTRTAFLQSVQNVIGDTNLYDIVSPEVTYINFNFIHQDYKRTATEGNGLISLDIWCREVRPASSSTSNTTTSTSGGNTSSTDLTGTPQGTINDDFAAINAPQSPSASPQVNDGNVSPTNPTTGQQNLVNNYDFAVQ
jgi:hypothetical protein